MLKPASIQPNGKGKVRQVNETLLRLAPVGGFHKHPRTITPASFDCVQVVFPRDGSLILDGELRVQPLSVGQVALVAPGALIGYQAEGLVATTTLLAGERSRAGLRQHTRFVAGDRVCVQRL
ncbi:MAG: hypothetical protein KDB08_01305 [Microthrixaceae bacterium]|nr:hypothetical protein [Microthrixaceae bacterium]